MKGFFDKVKEREAVVRVQDVPVLFLPGDDSGHISRLWFGWACWRNKSCGSPSLEMTGCNKRAMELEARGRPRRPAVDGYPFKGEEFVRGVF